MNIIAVVNQKGGVAKTTTTVSLGGVLARAHRRTLLVDLDPQGSLSGYFGIDVGCAGGVYEIFAGRRPQPQATRFFDLDVLPASPALATLERQAANQPGLGRVLADALVQCQGYETLILDCPPGLGVLMVNALAAADQVIIPVQTEFLALAGLERMLDTLDRVSRSLRRSVPAIILPVMHDRRTRAQMDCLRLLNERYADRLWPEAVPEETAFREASRMGAPITWSHPRARGAEVYQSLADTLLRERARATASMPTPVPA